MGETHQSSLIDTQSDPRATKPHDLREIFQEIKDLRHCLRDSKSSDETEANPEPIMNPAPSTSPALLRPPDPPDFGQPNQISTVKATPKVTKASTTKLRKYSCEEAYDRMTNGLCMFCDELDTPGHYSKKHNRSKILMIECDEDQFYCDEAMETNSSTHEIGSISVNNTIAETIQDEDSSLEKKPRQGEPNMYLDPVVFSEIYPVLQVPVTLVHRGDQVNIVLGDNFSLQKEHQEDSSTLFKSSSGSLRYSYSHCSVLSLSEMIFPISRSDCNEDKSSNCHYRAGRVWEPGGLLANLDLQDWIKKRHNHSDMSELSSKLNGRGLQQNTNKDMPYVSFEDGIKAWLEIGSYKQPLDTTGHANFFAEMTASLRLVGDDVNNSDRQSAKKVMLRAASYELDIPLFDTLFDVLAAQDKEILGDLISYAAYEASEKLPKSWKFKFKGKYAKNESPGDKFSFAEKPMVNYANTGDYDHQLFGTLFLRVHGKEPQWKYHKTGKLKHEQESLLRVSPQVEQHTLTVKRTIKCKMKWICKSRSMKPLTQAVMKSYMKHKWWSKEVLENANQFDFGDIELQLGELKAELTQTNDNTDMWYFLQNNAWMLIPVGVGLQESKWCSWSFNEKSWNVGDAECPWLLDKANGLNKAFGLWELSHLQGICYGIISHKLFLMRESSKYEQLTNATSGIKSASIICQVYRVFHLQRPPELRRAKRYNREFSQAFSLSSLRTRMFSTREYCDRIIGSTIRLCSGSVFQLPKPF